MLAYKVATQPRAHQSAYADTFYCSAQSASVFMQTFATAQPRARRSASEAVAKQGSRYRVHASLLILYTCLYFILAYTLYLTILYTCLYFILAYGYGVHTSRYASKHSGICPHRRRPQRKLKLRSSQRKRRSSRTSCRRRSA